MLIQCIAKKNKIVLPSCFREGCHTVLKFLNLKSALGIGTHSFVKVQYLIQETVK